MDHCSHVAELHYSRVMFHAEHGYKALMRLAARAYAKYFVASLPDLERGC